MAGKNASLRAALNGTVGSARFPAVAAGEDGLGSKHVCDDADRWRGLPVTRTNIAYALEQESRCWLVGRAVRVGVAGKDGAAGRSSAHSEYATGLTRSKVVVTANPTHWEGDARLAEAMRSGALVLVDRMVNPHSAVVNGSTVLVYRSVREMLEYVAALTRPGAVALRAEADLVAARGRRMAKAHPTPLRHTVGIPDTHPRNSILGIPDTPGAPDTPATCGPHIRPRSWASLRWLRRAQAEREHDPRLLAREVATVPLLRVRVHAQRGEPMRLHPAGAERRRGRARAAGAVVALNMPGAPCSLQRVSALTSTEYGFSLTKHRRSHDSLLFVKLRVTPSRTQNCFT